jgi:hypothetical protein
MQRRSVGSIGVVLTFGMLEIITGCSSRPEVKFPDTVPFSGRVTLDGQPLTGATVTFSPIGQNKGVMPANGYTDEAGKYALSIGSAKKKPGAVPGKYKVVISQLKTSDGAVFDPAKKSAVPPRETLPPKYSEIVQSKLEATIPDKGGSEDFELKLK